MRPRGPDRTCSTVTSPIRARSRRNEAFPGSEPLVFRREHSFGARNGRGPAWPWLFGPPGGLCPLRRSDGYDAPNRVPHFTSGRARLRLRAPGAPKCRLRRHGGTTPECPRPRRKALVASGRQHPATRSSSAPCRRAALESARVSAPARKTSSLRGTRWRSPVPRRAALESARVSAPSTLQRPS
jgi:hypothetical protein